MTQKPSEGNKSVVLGFEPSGHNPCPICGCAMGALTVCQNIEAHGKLSLPSELSGWEERKHNFCKHISDWSYFSAEEELEKMRSDELQLQREEIGKEFVEWFFGGTHEDVEEAIERITGVKCNRHIIKKVEGK